jgi:cytoskeletal protein RodZ
MQLNDLIEEHSIKAISQKTMISEENIESLIQRDFAALKRVKALGFISILERTYGLDLRTLKEDAVAYYEEHEEAPRITLDRPLLEEKRSQSRLIPLIVLGLLAYASWYFFTQYDRKHLAAYLPFSEHSSKQEKAEQAKSEAPAEVAKSLKIENAIMPSEHTAVQGEQEKEEKRPDQMQPVDTQVQVIQSDIPATDNRPQETSAETTLNTPEPALQSVMIIPERRLWFGLVDMESGERKHYTVAESFVVDVSSKSWLVATSSAPFSLQAGEETTSFNDARAHYFKIDKHGIERLNKEEYVALGGYAKW